MKHFLLLFYSLLFILLFQNKVLAQGDSCANAIQITSLPFSYTGTTCGFGDDYSNANACATYYLNGDDFLFVYTPTTNESVTGSLTSDATWVGIIVTNGCPDGGTCVGTATNSGPDVIKTFTLMAGITYFFTVSTYPSPQCINNFTFELTPYANSSNCNGGPICPSNSLLAADLCDNAVLLDNNVVCGNTSSNYTSLNSQGIDEDNEQLGNVFCGSLENNSWLKFIASDITATFNVYVCNCLDGYGIQMAIFSSSDCLNFNTHSNCWNPGEVINGTVSATGLTIGEAYYIMIDGNAGDVCDFSIEGTSGVHLVGAEIIESQSNFVSICNSGESLHLHAFGGTDYHWTPTIGLNNPNIADPIATPMESITYTCAISGGDIPDTVYSSLSIAVLNSILVNPSSCNSGNNLYSFSGELSFIGIPNEGYIVISDNSGSSETYYPPFSNPLPFSLTGLISNGLNHTVAASFAGQTNCLMQTTYLAPAPCSSCSIFAGNDVNLCGLTANLNALIDTSIQTQTWLSIQPGVVFSNNLSATSQVTVTSPGTYYFVWQTINDSGLVCTDTVIYIFNPMPQTPVISFDNTSLTSNAATGNQWYNQNGIIVGATNSTYTPTVSGTYYCIVEENGCSSGQSNSINIVVLGMSTNINESTFSLYPNPANNEITLELKNYNAQENNYKIYGSDGRLVYEGLCIGNKTQISLSHLPQGLYTISVYSGDSVCNERFLIEK